MIPGRVRIRDLLRTTGATDRIEGSVSPGKIGLSNATLDGPIAYALTLESETGRIQVTGTARARWSGSCRRCLEPTSGELTVPVVEIFETHPTEGETWPVDDDEIDLTAALTQALVLELPLAPLCRPDCAGPDPQRYPTTVESDEQEAAAPTPDPRWAALEGLRLGDGPDDAEADD